MTKQITTSQLEAMTWEVVEIELGDHEIDTHIVDVGMTEEGEVIEGKVYNSYMYATIKLRSAEEKSITYTIDAMAHNKDDRHSLTGAYEFYIDLNENGENAFDALGFEILDINGEIISEKEAAYQIGSEVENSTSWENAFEKLLPTKPVEEIE